MTPTKRRGRTVPPVTENIARTLGAESEVLDLLGTRHQLRVDVKLTASSCDEVTVLQMSFSLARRAMFRAHLRSEIQDQNGVELVVYRGHSIGDTMSSV